MRHVCNDHKNIMFIRVLENAGQQKMRIKIVKSTWCSLAIVDSSFSLLHVTDSHQGYAKKIF